MYRPVVLLLPTLLYCTITASLQYPGCNIPGQVYTECGSACPPTCADLDPICTDQCVPGCQCPRGTVLKENRCVLPKSCSIEVARASLTQFDIQCSIPDQVYTECGSACPPTCADLDPICTDRCVPGCQCPRGTVLQENRCVLPKNCIIEVPTVLPTLPPFDIKCSIPGQLYTECGSACPPTCADLDPICTDQCVPGCQCPRGTVLKENRCVLPKSCSIGIAKASLTQFDIQCTIPGQVYTECGSACPPTCADLDPICTDRCVPGCQCPRGTVLKGNHCVLPKSCDQLVIFN